MKVVEVRIIFEFLSKLKLNKFEKDTRIAILKNYTEMFTPYKEQEAKMEELKKKIFTDDDLKSIQEAVENKTNLSQDLINKNTEYNSVLTSLFDSECDIKITKVSEEKFVEGLANSDIDFTPIDIVRLKPIFE